MTLSLTRAGTAVAAVALPLSAVLIATPAMAATDATISVLHAIPEGAGADVVDIYANGELLIDNFTPGTLETVNVPAGTYDLAVFADGQTPEGDEEVLILEAVEVAAGLNATVAAHLTENGKPALNVFVNDVSEIPAGDARLTVRHLAAAPAVDVLADGAVLFQLANPEEDMIEVPAGEYEAAVNLAGTDTTAIGPAPVMLEEGTNTIVYAWGSTEEDNLALATQVIDNLGAHPDHVPAGGGSTSGAPLWAFALVGAALAGVLAAGTRLAKAGR